MINLNKKIALLGITFAIIIGLIVGVLASSTITDIKAQINSAINIKICGCPIAYPSLQPIIYNNQAYIPLSAFSTIFNLPVKWYASTNTIDLGNNILNVDSSNIDLLDKLQGVWVNDDDPNSKLYFDKNQLDTQSEAGYQNIGKIYKITDEGTTDIDGSIIYDFLIINYDSSPNTFRFKINDDTHINLIRDGGRHTYKKTDIEIVG